MMKPSMQPATLPIRPPPGLEEFVGGGVIPQMRTPPGVWNTDGCMLTPSMSTLPQLQQIFPGEDACMPSWLTGDERSVARAPGSLAREALRAKAAEYVATMLVPTPPLKGTTAIGGSFSTLPAGRQVVSPPSATVEQPPTTGGRQPAMQATSPFSSDAIVGKDRYLHAPLSTRPVQNETVESPPTLGSAMHPHGCAGACRYVKRKGGCRDGANCPNCHLCFWRRDQHVPRKFDVSDAKKVEIEAPLTPETADLDDGIVSIDDVSTAGSDSVSASMSIGSQGHPLTCAAACRYVRRKSGCRDGAACVNCHACVWRRQPIQDVQAVVPAGLTATKNADGFLDDGRNKLQALIHLMMQTTDADGMNNGLCEPCEPVSL